MKKILIAMFALSTTFLSADAQIHRKGHHAEAGSENAMQLKSLNLTDAQKQALQASRENVKAQLADLEKNDKLTVKEYRARKAAILKSQKTSLDNVLTAEQKTELAKQKQGKKGRGYKKGGKAMGHSHDMKDMKATLNLTAEQEAKWKSQRESQMLQAKAIKENSQLSETQKKEQLVNLKKAQQESLKEILTPEQISLMKANRKDRKVKNK